MTTLALTCARIQKKVKSTIRSVEAPLVNWKIVCFVCFFVTLILLTFYVYQINVLTRGFYLINVYEQQIKEVSEENKNLQISFAESSFLGSALEKIKALNFQKVGSVKYIQIPGGYLAQAK